MFEVAESVPQAAPLQPGPVSAQVTPLFCLSFCTVAVKLCICPVCSETRSGETLTLTGGAGAVTVTVATAFFVVSATDVAVSVTVAGLGTAVGPL